MKRYFRPIPIADPAVARQVQAAGRGWSLGGGSGVFCEVECIERGADGVSRRHRMAAGEMPAELRDRISTSRAEFAGVALDRPVLMGVVNVTPDSFSDGGQHASAAEAIACGLRLAGEGVAILDVGGESTRPGAQPVNAAVQIERVVPVVRVLREALPTHAISVDTRLAEVAGAALDAGAGIVNDVAAFGRDPQMPGLVADRNAHVCLMHAQGKPETMQDAPHYADVLLDIYDWLETRVALAEAAGIPRMRIAVDPGIGFGKTLAHNLALLQGLALFLGLGCALLVGVSRKAFIGSLSGERNAAARMAGSVAAALHAAAQGAHILRVHDVAATAQALAVWAPLHRAEAA